MKIHCLLIGGFHLASDTSFSKFEDRLPNEYEDLMVVKENKCDHSQIPRGNNRKIRIDHEIYLLIIYDSE